MIFEWPSNFWAVGPFLTLPLFHSGQPNATPRQTKAVYEEAVAKYRQTVLTAFAEVENKSPGGGWQAPENNSNAS